MNTSNNNQSYNSSYAQLYLNNSKIAEKYNQAISNKFEEFIWSLEKHFLHSIFKYMNTKQMNYMDYACGTGRIVSFLSREYEFKRIVGSDISDIMLEGAKKESPNNHIGFIRLNVAENNGEFKESLDVVTSFRLFLNLEDNNRLIILKGLNKIIKENGVLIVNNHMNRFSLKGLVAFCFHHILKRPLKHEKKQNKKSVINTMTEPHFKRLLRESGFIVEKVYRFSLLPGHNNFLLLPSKPLYYLEIFLAKVPILNLFSKDQIYVCRKTITKIL